MSGKFRVYENGKIYEDEHLIGTFNEVYRYYKKENNSGNSEVCLVEVNNAKILRFTGYFDKNNRPIYEDDILQCSSWWWGNCFVYFCIDDSSMRFGLAHYADDPNRKVSCNIWHDQDIYVVGNVNISPELVGANKSNHYMVVD